MDEIFNEPASIDFLEKKKKSHNCLPTENSSDNAFHGTTNSPHIVHRRKEHVFPDVTRDTLSGEEKWKKKKKKTGGSITKDDNNVTKMEIKKERKKKDSESATENFNFSFSLFPLVLRMYGCY